MSELDAAPSVEAPIVDRAQRSGNIVLLVLLAAILLAAAAAFALIDRSLAEPLALAVA